MTLRTPNHCALVLLLWPLMLWSASVCADDKDALAAWGKRYEHEILPIITSHCLKCHQGDEPDGGFDLSVFKSGQKVVGKLDAWDNVAKRIRLKEMPPEGSPQLNDQQKAAFHGWVDSRPRQDLCSQIASEETTAWYRGYVMSRRLTRTEYLHAIRDALGVEVDATVQVPSDGAGGEGFDTNGASLFTSAIHIEQYLAVASQAIDRAIDREQKGGATTSEPDQRLLPSPGAVKELGETAAAQQSIARFARRAWRRRVAEDEVKRLGTLYQSSRDRGNDFAQAIGDALKAILVSPNFLFVVESESAEGGVQRLTPHQLAMRLSLLVWSSIPDEELLAAADADELNSDEQVIGQLHRMLADPKSLALGESFGLQWLGLSNFLTGVHPDQEKFPEYDDQLARDLRDEAIRTVAGVFRENQSLLNLLRSDRVIVNERLAKHYGLDYGQARLPEDNQWQSLAVEGGRRGGVMTLGAVLISASYPRRTSPVLRGRWVLEEVLGSRVPPPPPGVPALEEAVAEHAMSMRERLEQHRKQPECASCHNRMDPLGFGLENYDALGRWRDSEDGLAIDASGKLPSGETFSGPDQLKQLIGKRSGEFERHFVRKLLGYALGRELNKFDDCVIDQSLKRLAENEHRAQVVLETIVTSYPFQYRFFKATEQ